MRLRCLAVVACFLFLPCVSCDTGRTGPVHAVRLRVVTTLFPLYDIARSIGGDRADVTLLLPPGMEAHSFEPKPGDVIRVGKADLFIYTNPAMEPWAADIIDGINAGKTLVIDASRGAHLLKAGKSPASLPEMHGHGAGRKHHDGEGMDPHLWLDFDNARIMVDTILAGFTARDPENSAWYSANAEAYKAKLTELDDRFRAGLAACEKRVFLHGGHFAFGYLANRYGLRYESAYAVSGDAEPSPAKIAYLISRMRALGLRYIFTEELVEPRVAETIARETGAKILMLHGAHNISRDDLAAGVTFFSLMERNLSNLRIGMQCR
ncbi:MAG: zinc ABC transporter substrate-binding protein [Geobacteraceae bacterium]|nr:zinc ABC transporter substrate-binding protein [Geobacteraceae bacterium]